jgi:hypothetical protein
LGGEMPISWEATKHKIPQNPMIQQSKHQTQTLKMEAAKASLFKRFWAENHGIYFPSSNTYRVSHYLMPDFTGWFLNIKISKTVNKEYTWRAFLKKLQIF